MSALPAFALVESALADLVTPRRGPEVVAVGSRPEVAPGGAADADASAGPRIGPQARALGALLGVDVGRRLARGRATGSAAEVVELQVDVAHGEPGAQVERLLVVGLGDATPRDHRRAGAALARRTRGTRRVVVGATLRADPEALRAFVEGWGLASYSFTRRTTAPTPAARAVDLLVEAATPAHAEALRRAVRTVEAVHLARDLANTPSSEKNPAWLARRAERAVRGTRVAVEVRDAARLEAEGFGGLLAVGAGSPSPPCLVELRYVPPGAGPRTPHVVLVGKGITFDSGGLSLKPSDGMITMKTDMAAGGAVVAVMSALEALEVPVRVTGLVAAAENMPSGTAQRPGDVIHHYGGTTVEVLNTDAEGRLVLADALAYADRELDADAVVDLATLTGAATLGLGRRHAALFATDDRLAAGLEDAAAASGDQVWRMPLVEDYRAALDSEVADLSHISRDRHISGGAITAALFLREFAGDRPWAHLDIAGPGRSDGDSHELTKGATGFGTRLLLRWLESPRGAAAVRTGRVRRA